MKKIDENLICNVSILGNNKQKCIVWATDKASYDELLTRVSSNKIFAKYPFLNAFAMIVETKDLHILNNLQSVFYVSSVQKLSVLMHRAKTLLGVDKLHKKGIVGSNITVAVIDTGCFSHVDFFVPRNRVLFFKDFINGKKVPYDDNGHGTFVCGVLGGNGVASGKRFCGVATDCNLVVLKALDKLGQTQATTILDAMQWILDNKEKFDIKVVCMSFGSEPLKTNDPLMKGAEVLWDNGICVVAASGNDGPEFGTIKSPGASPKIITVGSADDAHKKDSISVAPFSSRGPAFSFVKPDLIAPGVDITATTNNLNFYGKMSGTSVSTPMVAGTCALLLSEYGFLSPNQVKNILLNSAHKIDCDKNECGFGFLDAFKSVFI